MPENVDELATRLSVSEGKRVKAEAERNSLKAYLRLADQRIEHLKNVIQLFATWTCGECEHKGLLDEGGEPPGTVGEAAQRENFGNYSCPQCIKHVKAYRDVFFKK